MFSKLRVLAVCLLLLGCAGENEFHSRPPNIRFDSPKFRCLKNADETLSRFLGGTLSDSEVQTLWNCFDLAIVQFAKLIHGREGQTYTAEEIAKFLDDYFLDGRNLASETNLLHEFMQVKRLFVGGAVDRVTHYDLVVRTRALLQEFKSITLALNPHMKTLRDGIVQGDEKVAGEPVEAAAKALNAAGARLAQLIGDQHYSFTRLRFLLTELEQFLQKSSPQFSFSDSLRFLPLFGEFKGLIVAPPQDLIRGEDWPRLMDSVTNILGWVLKYRVHVHQKDWSQGRGFEVLSGIIKGALGELEAGMERHPNQEIALVDLDRVVELLAKLELLPMDIDARAAKEILRRLIDRVLDPHPTASTALNRGDLEALRQEVERWIQAQNFLNLVMKHGLPTDDDPEVLDANSEMLMLMQTRWPMLRDGKARLVFSAETYAGSYDQVSLSTLNWQRALIRPLMRGYAQQTSADGATGLTQAALISLFHDWQALAEKLGLFESGQSEASAKKVFMEGNLFLPSSNGDDRFDFVEGVQYVAYAVSGLNSGSDIRKNFAGRCDSPDGGTYLAACVRDEIFNQRQALLENFPFVLDFIGDDLQKWLRFEALLENTTREGLSERPFTKGELVEMMVLLHFVETFFANFDADRTQTMSVDETLNAFPVFQRSLKEIVKKSFGLTMGQDDLKGLLTFLFKYGKPPQSSFAGMLKFLHWRWNPQDWRYNADRMRVVQILAELNASR